jgi:glycerol-3-phosphate acyltransferase PlsY
MTGLLFAAVAGYLLGSVPFGLVVTKFAGLGDIRSIGSGNIGATNVLRTGRHSLAAVTLLLDGGKGAVAVLLGGLLFGGTWAAIAAGGGAMLGHTFPLWLGFKGGKGVATALGVLLAIAWPVGVASCMIWLVVAFVFRISSLSALVGLGLAPLVGWLVATPEVAVLGLFLAGLVYFRHRGNIGRLLRGEEPRISFRKTTTVTASPAPAPPP